MKQNYSSFRSAMRFKRAIGVAALAAALAACGGGGSNDSVWQFRGINLVSDAPTVQFVIDGAGVETADYGSVTVYHPAHAGSRPLQLAIKNPSDLSGTDQGYTNIGSAVSSDFQGKTNYNLIATGTIDSPHQYLVSGLSSDTVADNQINYQFINAATNTGDVDVLITAPEAGITTAKDLGTVALGAASTATAVTINPAPGVADTDTTTTRTVNITIEIKHAGTTIYQSTALNFAEQNRLLFVIADNFGPADIAPVKVLTVTGTTAQAAAVELDPAGGSELRFGNLSPDGGAMDLRILDNGAADLFAPNVALGQASTYQLKPADTYNTIATPAGNAGSYLFVNNFTTVGARSYTLYAQGDMADLRGLVIADDRRKVPTEAHFRFLHAAPSQGSSSLDVYVTQAGSAFDLTATIPPIPTAAAVAYLGVSGQFALKPGTYDVRLAQAGAKTTVLGPVPLVLTAGMVETVAIDDDSQTGDLTLLPVDDARP